MQYATPRPTECDEHIRLALKWTGSPSSDRRASMLAAITAMSGDLLLACGPELFSTLVRLNLVDELEVMVRPTVLGRGKAVYGDVQEILELNLILTRVFESGVVWRRYQLA